jgi:hypothetical protein
MWKIFLDDSAVQIVHTVTERDLGERQPMLTVSCEMVDVIR